MNWDMPDEVSWNKGVVQVVGANIGGETLVLSISTVGMQSKMNVKSRESHEKRKGERYGM